MGKDKKEKELSQKLWVIDYIDRMTPSDSFESALMSFEEAERKYNALTDGGVKNTDKDKKSLMCYRLRQLR
ncbi:hypothetical protein FWJ25_11110 [Marinobacter salinexigens]|uniref:Uncharacterized protein n=1 Tax=Marinobacter salinexigens TaxID=2919747 RepID=A0A5B0VHR5_9GAMM|nr:hypothetical protein [Marinobacter salinexigens]KAA1173948.1 hypothetical protein FWJ25_11110 [Marinobacter salinexigens]